MFRLLTEHGRFADAVAQSDFTDWLEKAHSARYIRNRYVHGHWDLLPLRREKPVDFRVFPWLEDKFGEDAREEMTLADLERTASELEEVFQNFMRIRKKLRI